MKSSIFKQRFIVPATAIDALNHVNNITYLQWCLEIAEDHWISKTSKKQREENVWVVLNHFISYKNPSFLGEELETQTWIESYEGVKSLRKYKIIRPLDGKTIVEAETLWCFLDGKTFRPAKITEEISNLFI
ncbi:putative thioesterase [Aequorivita sublithincola DSM 14238]|uniref:Putative thioesterase n=1 Tax=Aequorivita sublithincola (strain DSM 14238 / LMG 21431 / ACAM 643 / 9-3) TaxID=746697 RepID=I3YU17_AEQSU|nr:acyl-CoA thioesterase [Aequorivita sublithincola]AFL80485.1 putative thioesterase [Aequorivita sublithincola DSM 14238]